jgi:hypothetical protein
MSKPNFRPIASPLAVDDQALERVNERLGVPTMVRARTSSLAAEPALAAPSAAMQPVLPPLRAQEKLTTEMPLYLMDALKQEAARRRVSVRYLVMLGLQATGFTIQPEDLVPDARRSTRRVR